PHHVDEVPVQADVVEDARRRPAREVSGERTPENDREGDEPDGDVQAVEAGEGEERRREEIARQRDAALVEGEILARLPDDEDEAEEDGEAERAGRAGAVAAVLRALRQPEREARGEEAGGVDAHLLHVERRGGGRAAVGRLRRVVEDVGEDEDDEERRLGDDEAPDADRVLVEPRLALVLERPRARLAAGADVVERAAAA